MRGFAPYLRAFAWLMLLSLLVNPASAQLKGGLDQYYYTKATTPATYIPRAYYDDAKNWHREIRYNYEAENTFSLFFGKIFSGGKGLTYSITPMMGISAGQFTGASPGVNVELKTKGLTLVSESQYSLSMTTRQEEFFFTWTELYKDLTPWLYGGVSFQQTNCYRSAGKFDPGAMLGVTLGNVSLPVYLFKPGSKNQYFVLGVNWEWQTKSPSISH